MSHNADDAGIALTAPPPPKKPGECPKKTLTFLAPRITKLQKTKARACLQALQRRRHRLCLRRLQVWSLQGVAQEALKGGRCLSMACFLSR